MPGEEPRRERLGGLEKGKARDGDGGAAGPSKAKKMVFKPNTKQVTRKPARPKPEPGSGPAGADASLQHLLEKGKGTAASRRSEGGPGSQAPAARTPGPAFYTQARPKPATRKKKDDGGKKKDEGGASGAGGAGKKSRADGTASPDRVRVKQEPGGGGGAGGLKAVGGGEMDIDVPADLLDDSPPAAGQILDHDRNYPVVIPLRRPGQETLVVGRSIEAVDLSNLEDRPVDLPNGAAPLLQTLLAKCAAGSDSDDGDAAAEAKLIIVQLPEVLPVQRPPSKAVAGASANTKSDPDNDVQIVGSSLDKGASGGEEAGTEYRGTVGAINPQVHTDDGAALHQLPRGRIGKLRIYDDGTTGLVIGDVELSVSAGAPVEAAQQVALLRAEDRSCVILGDVEGRVVAAPNIEMLMEQTGDGGGVPTTMGVPGERVMETLD
ncbi:unnamed protein product [Pedinophyceae sp. YPF-701]|nr:unnamed protein product [Pedinophyceae sp. YPF-701]